MPDSPAYALRRARAAAAASRRSRRTSPKSCGRAWATRRRCISSASSSPTTTRSPSTRSRWSCKSTARSARASPRRRGSAKSEAFELALHDPHVRSADRRQRRCASGFTFPTNWSTSLSDERRSADRDSRLHRRRRAGRNDARRSARARRHTTVTVLEKYEDFLRDFRGDTVHPSTMTVLDELGCSTISSSARTSEIVQIFGTCRRRHDHDRRFQPRADAMTKFLAHHAAVGLLELSLREGAGAIPVFSLLMRTEGDGPHRERRPHRRRARNRRRTDALDIRADVVVGMRRAHLDAASTRRRSRRAISVRRWTCSGCAFQNTRPIKMRRFGFVGAGAVLVLIDRDDYWQCAIRDRKGQRRRGSRARHRCVSRRARADRAGHCRSRRTRSRVGTMSNCSPLPSIVWIVGISPACSSSATPRMRCRPIGGVGINLAIQDAVATANISLGGARATRARSATTTLAAVQRRRTYPTVMTQGRAGAHPAQHHRATCCASKAPPKRAPRDSALSRDRFLVFRRIPAYIVGIGFRPEHVVLGGH